MQKSVSQQRSDTFKRYHRIMKESEKNPVVLLSPRTYGNIICNRPIPNEKDMPKLIKEYTDTEFLN